MQISALVTAYTLFSQRRISFIIYIDPTLALACKTSQTNEGTKDNDDGATQAAAVALITLVPENHVLLAYKIALRVDCACVTGMDNKHEQALTLR